MGCASSSASKPSRWSCKDYLFPDEVEPMEMPRSLAGLKTYGSSSMVTSTRPPPLTQVVRATSSSAGPSMSMNQSSTQAGGVALVPNQYSSPTRPSYLLGRGPPPPTYPADFTQAQQQGPSHSVDCQRRLVMLQNRQMRMLAHHQHLVLVPHLHLHTLPAPQLHLHQRHASFNNQNPVAQHNPWRRSSVYYGQGYIVAHHNHHHHVNFQ